MKSFIRLSIDRFSKTIAGIMRMASVDLTPLKRVLRLTLLRRHLPQTPLSTQLDGRIMVTGTANIHFGEHCRLGDQLEMGTEAAGGINLGSEVRINRGTTLVSYSQISIGSQTLIGEFVTIRDANHGTAPGTPIRQQDHDTAAIDIGKDVWVGRGTVILPGVTIGDHSIIGANSVVTHSIPENSIAVGSPARVIRQRDSIKKAA